MPIGQPGAASDASDMQSGAVAGWGVADYGLNGRVSWAVHHEVSLNLIVARSIPNAFTSVRLGLGFDLSRPLSRFLRR